MGSYLPVSGFTVCCVWVRSVLCMGRHHVAFSLVLGIFSVFVVGFMPELRIFATDFIKTMKENLLLSCMSV